MKAIVTGGAGFIGSHMIDRLLDDGFHVVCIDNYSTGRVENLSHIDKNKLTIVNEDVNNFSKIEKYFKGVKWVFHFAALADIVPSIQFPESYYNSNVNGTFSVLKASVKYNVEKFIYAASSSCYGIPDNYPTNENQEIRTEYPYALTKYLGELLVMHWSKVYKLPAISMRFFNAYGPRSRTSGTYGAVFGVFLAQKLNNSPFTIVGDGNQTRDFTFVTDVVDACVTAANSSIKNEIFNVGSDDTYSINYLVKLLGGDRNITYLPKRPGEPDCTYADISKIQTQLNWNPKVSFEDGVKIMLENIDYWENAPVWTPEKIDKATKDWFKFLK